MRRTILALSLLITASAAIASDSILRLSGWAEIPSTYRQPGPVSGQFTTPANDIGGPLLGIPDDTFNFPLQSVESVTPVDDRTLLVGLDNNYPGGNGRIPGTPDGTEIITLRSKVPLRTLRVQPCKDASTGSRNGSPHDGGNKGNDCR